jgi:hypothetical protein
LIDFALYCIVFFHLQQWRLGTTRCVSLAKQFLDRSGDSRALEEFEHDIHPVILVERGTSGTIAAFICCRMLLNLSAGQDAFDGMKLTASLPQIRSIRLAILAQVLRDWLACLDPSQYSHSLFDDSEMDVVSFVNSHSSSPPSPSTSVSDSFSSPSHSNASLSSQSSPTDSSTGSLGHQPSAISTVLPPSVFIQTVCVNPVFVHLSLD